MENDFIQHDIKLKVDIQIKKNNTCYRGKVLTQKY